MIRKLLLFLFLSLLFSIHAIQAQLSYNKTSRFLKANSIWMLSDSAGIDFNNGATPIRTTVPVGEGISNVCDPVTGALLFYANGYRCWNANGQIMPNGDSLLGNSLLGTSLSHVTTKQGSCIVPVIGSPGQYYLFSLNYQGRRAPAGSLFYSIVDMSLDNGAGNIIPDKKNILLDSTSLSEAMIAIPGNNCDMWLMVHNNTSPTYKAYHITINGIDTTPVTSSGVIANWLSTMAISPDRSYIALSVFRQMPIGGYGLEIARFDPTTGLVSDPLSLPISAFGSFSCAFSPDNSKLYADEHSPPTFRLVQFDISNYSLAAITSSKQIIASGNSADYHLRLYNDTIYAAHANAPHALNTINQPNNAGVACDYQVGSLPLLPGSTLSRGCLPAEVVFPYAPDTTIPQLVLDTFSCSGWESGIILKPEEVNANYHYTWIDNSGDTILSVSQDGTYWVRYTDGCRTRIDTFVLTTSPDLDPVISVDEFELTTTRSYAAYQWIKDSIPIPGANSRTYTVTENAAYQVAVTSDEGCSDTSAVYHVTNVTTIANVALLADQIDIYPNPSSDLLHINSPVKVTTILASPEGRVIVHAQTRTSIPLHTLAPGFYLLSIYDQEGRVIKTEKIVKQ